jgi:tetratricopeptide (TPR) repeat protein
MFRDHQVPVGDPRLDRVYHHFARNLDDILREGQRSGAGVVLTTVASNVRDCAPFGAMHRADLSSPDQAAWERLYQRGIAAEQAGDWSGAASFLAQAAKIDNAMADLRFRQARCALALGQPAEANRHFKAARDLDTLRFRCDSRLNDLIREAAAPAKTDQILLADAERLFLEQAEGELFYDHVHLTFEGNYLLARIIVEQIARLLPEKTTKHGPSGRAWPTLADCARRLAWTAWSQHAAAQALLPRLSDPPFTRQIDHELQLRRLRAQLLQLAPAVQPAGLDEAERACTSAVELAPDDPWLHAQLAVLRQETANLAGAEASARRWTDLVPSSADAWSQLGRVLAQEQKYAEAADRFRLAIEWDPQDVWARQNLAQTLSKLGRPNEAIEEYRRAVALKPRLGPAWLGLGLLLEARGDQAAAADCFARALTNRVRRLPELRMLARFCQKRGWAEAAADVYAEAIQVSPADPMLCIEAGQGLAAMGHQAAAAGFYAQAVQLAPELAPAHFLYGTALGRLGKPAEAAEQFRETVRLQPDLIEARLNLGLALLNQDDRTEALAQFEEVLRQSPTNALALKYAKALREKAAP